MSRALVTQTIGRIGHSRLFGNAVRDRTPAVDFVAWMAEFSSADAMNVDLTPEQKAFAQRAIESGRLSSEDDAVRQAIALWEERERQRAEFLLTLNEAKASVARIEGLDVTPDTMQQLAAQVKQRGRTRLLADLNVSR